MQEQVSSLPSTQTPNVPDGNTFSCLHPYASMLGPIAAPAPFLGSSDDSEVKRLESPRHQLDGSAKNPDGGVKFGKSFLDDVASFCTPKRYDGSGGSSGTLHSAGEVVSFRLALAEQRASDSDAELARLRQEMRILREACAHELSLIQEKQTAMLAEAVAQAAVEAKRNADEECERLSLLAQRTAAEMAAMCASLAEQEAQRAEQEAHGVAAAEAHALSMAEALSRTHARAQIMQELAVAGAVAEAEDRAQRALVKADAATAAGTAHVLAIETIRKDVESLRLEMMSQAVAEEQLKVMQRMASSETPPFVRGRRVSTRSAVESDLCSDNASEEAELPSISRLDVSRVELDVARDGSTPGSIVDGSGNCEPSCGHSRENDAVHPGQLDCLDGFDALIAEGNVLVSPEDADLCSSTSAPTNKLRLEEANYFAADRPSRSNSAVRAMASESSAASMDKLCSHGKQQQNLDTLRGEADDSRTAGQATRQCKSRRTSSSSTSKVEPDLRIRDELSFLQVAMEQLRNEYAVMQKTMTTTAATSAAELAAAEATRLQAEQDLKLVKNQLFAVSMSLAECQLSHANLQRETDAEAK
eukprot:6172977-Pleurochrysis_carterae.AAC.1